jgi:hypothetical protein
VEPLQRQVRELARYVLRSNIEDRDLDVADLSADDPGAFDVVLLLGVARSLQESLMALHQVAEVNPSLETHGDFLSTRRSAAALSEPDELKGDTSNWWGPNVAVISAMLRRRRAPVGTGADLHTKCGSAQPELSCSLLGADRSDGSRVADRGPSGTRVGIVVYTNGLNVSNPSLADDPAMPAAMSPLVAGRS